MRNTERSQPILSPMTTAQKKKRFRELARQDRIRTASELAEELEQPFLPLLGDCLTNVQRRRKAARPAWLVREGATTK
jgi:hypothetical protein